MKKELRHLGKKGRIFYGLDVLSIDAQVIRKITFTSDELMAQCPVTGGPDIYSVLIVLDPNEYTIETKSLKLYFETFHQKSILAEHLVSKMASDIFESTSPRSVMVSLTQNVRGGIKLEVVAQLHDDIEFMGTEAHL